MGSYTELTIDDYPVLSSKSYIYNDIYHILCESDKRIFNRSFNERNSIVWGNSDDKEIEVAYEYQTTVKIAIERLEIMGYSLKNTILDFNESKNKLIKELTQNLEYYDDGFMNMDDIYKSEIELLKSSNFDNFLESFIEIRIKRIAHYETEKYPNISKLSKYLLNNDGWFLNFPSSDLYFYCRAFLESCNKDALVIQDITEVVNAGYYTPEEEVINSLRKNHERITILTEGISDINIISKSIKLLYPHLFDYYNFKDFKISNASGSASQLLLEIKALIAINHKNKIIALFDNDGAGLTEFNKLKNINIPKNFKILTYPNLSLLENYPTSNNKLENVNGVAGSIEMYLGKDILQEEEKFIPIQLKNKGSHGHLKNKDNLQKKYFKKIKKCQKDPSYIYDYDWSEMKLLLKKIFEAFK